jgi:hypothetical protein
MGNPLPKLNQANITMNTQPDLGPKTDALQQEAKSAVGKKRSGSRAGLPVQTISNVVTKFSFATKGGIAPHNPYKVNQDAYLTNANLLNLRHCHFFSVCDGHGHYGQEVSGLLKHRLPFNIEHGL